MALWMDGPGHCGFGGCCQCTQLDVLMGPDRGLNRRIESSSKDKEGSHGRLTLCGPLLGLSRHLVKSTGQQGLEVSVMPITCRCPWASPLMAQRVVTAAML